jgi:hypothetical protein
MLKKVHRYTSSVSKRLLFFGFITEKKVIWLFFTRERELSTILVESGLTSVNNYSYVILVLGVAL